MAKAPKEVATTETKTGIVERGESLPSYIKQGNSRGNENVSKDDIQLPRIDVLQALSPQINPKKDNYIDGAESGMLFNTLTGELYETVQFVPVTFVKRFLVWVNRKKDAKGGLRGVFNSADEAEQFVAQHEEKDKLEIVPTAEHLVLLASGDEVILSMAKSKMKVSRKFNSLVRLNGGDRFSRLYTLSTVSDEGPKGEFMNISIGNASLCWPNEALYRKAEALYESVTSGARKVNAAYDESADIDGGEANSEDEKY